MMKFNNQDVSVLSYSELVTLFTGYEKIARGDVKYWHPVAYIEIDNSSFDKDYSFEARTYEVSANNKAFIPGQISTSMFGTSIDKTDVGVRLDVYVHDKEPSARWKISKCYISVKDMVAISVALATNVAPLKEGVS